MDCRGERTELRMFVEVGVPDGDGVVVEARN